MISAPEEANRANIRRLVRSAATAADDMEAAMALAEEAFENLLEEGITVNDVAIELAVTHAVAAQLLSRELPLSALIRSAEYRSASDEDASSMRRRAAFRAAQIGDDADQGSI